MTSFQDFSANCLRISLCALAPLREAFFSGASVNPLRSSLTFVPRNQQKRMGLTEKSENCSSFGDTELACGAHGMRLGRTPSALTFARYHSGEPQAVPSLHSGQALSETKEESLQGSDSPNTEILHSLRQPAGLPELKRMRQESTTQWPAVLLKIC